jgi:hypothetical protein
MTDRLTEPALCTDELRNSLLKALHLLEQYRSQDSIQIILELLRHPIPEEVRVLLHESRDRFYLYLDDEAAEALREAIDAVTVERDCVAL